MAQRLSQKEALGKEVIEGLRKEKMILTWYRDKPEGWTLASGLWSPFYINLRLITSAPSVYKKAGEAMSMLVEEAGFRPSGDRRRPFGGHRMVGIAMGGIPFANAITLNTGIPSLYTRKLPENVKTDDEVKSYVASHGQHALVEGDLTARDRLAVVDDLVTGFTSKELAIRQIGAEADRRGIAVDITDIVVLLDREQGAAAKATEQGFRLHSVIPFASKGLGWLRDSFEPVEYDTISDYLKNPVSYQHEQVRQRLAHMARR